MKFEDFDDEIQDEFDDEIYDDDEDGGVNYNYDDDDYTYDDGSDEEEY